MFIFNKILVVVFVLQILMILTSISAQKNPPLAPPTSNKTTTPSNNTHNDLSHKDAPIITEGGGTIKLQLPPKTTSAAHNREGVLEEVPPHINNNAISTSNTSSTSLPSLKYPAAASTTSTTERTIPVNEVKPTEKPNHPKIFPRKGVNLEPETQSGLNATTTKPKPKKPTLTVGSEEPYAPSHFQSSSKSNSSAAQSIPQVPNTLNSSNQGNTQKYVVPIVIVILSVPFVAILISVLYKRGAEWWKYRHYSRMDFLINGIYDN